MAVQDKPLAIKGRLDSGPPILLDGAMGTQLLRRGVDVSLPLWSAKVLEKHPEVVLDIHQEYAAAGAEILTTNTFRTTSRTFQKVMGDGEAARRKARKLTRRAVRAAQAAASETVFVAGSVAPLEDCYQPELFPGSRAALGEFSELGQWLVNDGVDLLLMETMGRTDETESALQATAGQGRPRWVSFILRDEQSLLNGDSLTDAARMAVDMGVDAVLINCSNLLDSLEALEHLQKVVSIPVGVYPNLGKSIPSAEGRIARLYPKAEFLEQMKRAIGLGARIIGTCCGSGPEHTAVLRELIYSLA